MKRLLSWPQETPGETQAIIDHRAATLNLVLSKFVDMPKNKTSLSLVELGELVGGKSSQWVRLRLGLPLKKDTGCFRVGNTWRVPLAVAKEFIINEYSK